MVEKVVPISIIIFQKNIFFQQNAQVQTKCLPKKVGLTQPSWEEKNYQNNEVEGNESCVEVKSIN